MLIKYTGKYVKIYSIIKITFSDSQLVWLIESEEDGAHLMSYEQSKQCYC